MFEVEKWACASREENRITDAFGAVLEDDVDILRTTRVPNFSRRRYGKRRVRDLVRCCGGDKEKLIQITHSQNSSISRCYADVPLFKRFRISHGLQKSVSTQAENGPSKNIPKEMPRKTSHALATAGAWKRRMFHVETPAGFMPDHARVSGSLRVALARRKHAATEGCTQVAF